MTIAVGILTGNAFVVAADSQEGTGIAGDLKQSIGKISYFDSGYRDESDEYCTHAICVAGAGDSGYLNVIKSEVISKFRELGKKPDLDVFDEDLKETIRCFFMDHVVPFSQFQMDLQVRLIVAAQSMKDQRLWVTNLSTVMQPQLYTAIGSGERWATSVIPWRIYAADEQRATIAAAYAVFVAKSFAEGCGGETSIISIRPNFGLVAANSDAIIELEKLFRTFRQAEENCVGAVFGLPKLLTTGGWLTCGAITKQLDHLTSEMSKIPLYPSMQLDSPDPQPTTGDPSPPPPSLEKPGGSDES